MIQVAEPAQRAGLPPSFWRLFVSTASSNLGDGISKTAFPLMAASLTRDPLAVSLLTAAFFAPWLVLAVPSGALIDRVDRTKAMGLANAARAVVVVGLAVALLTGAGTIVSLYAAALLLGTAEIVADVAYRAILPAVVSSENLDRGNGYLQGAELVSDAFLGAPVASVTFAAAASSPFFLSAGGFALSALVARFLPSTRPGRRTSADNTVRSFATEIVEGVSWLARHPVLRSVAVMSAFMGFVGAGTSAVLVLFVLDVLHVPAELYGPFIVTLGVGGLIGSLTASAVSARLGRGPALRLALGVSAVALLGLGVVGEPLVAVALFVVEAWSVLLWNVLSMSLRQQLIPEQLFGRVQGAWRTLVFGAMPFGAIVGGLVASRFGLGAPFIVEGLGDIAVLVVGWRLLGAAGVVQNGRAGAA